MVRRADNFEQRRKSIAGLSDDELHRRFWSATARVVDPLIELARTHTSPSIERSVLLRMGLSSLEARAIVEKCVEKGLLGKGAGNAVYRLACRRGCSINEAGADLASGRGWDEVQKEFEIQ
ncbi:MAG: ornithine aminomutase [Firmicutes bacterium]|nr:ornithine aminomutase [Bacillota bacterium]